MYIHISYDEGIQEDSNIEAIIRKVCDEVSRVYGLEEDEMIMQRFTSLIKNIAVSIDLQMYCPLHLMKGTITKAVKRNIIY